MLVIFISRLQEKRKNSDMQNVRLLDGMHEGLLILNKADNAMMLSNFTAVKILRNFLLR